MHHYFSRLWRNVIRKKILWFSQQGITDFLPWFISLMRQCICISTHFHDHNIFQCQNIYDIFYSIYFSTLNSTCLEKEKEHLLKSASIVRIKDNGSSNQKNVITKTEISPNNRPKGIPITSPTTTVTNQNKSNNAKRRKAEDKMAMIFIAIVTGWLITNFPRICLNFQEVLNVNKQQECMKQHPHSL